MSKSKKFKEKGSNRTWVIDSNSPKGRKGRVIARRLYKGRTVGKIPVEFSQEDFDQRFVPCT